MDNVRSCLSEAEQLSNGNVSSDPEQLTKAVIGLALQAAAQEAAPYAEQLRTVVTLLRAHRQA